MTTLPRVHLHLAVSDLDRSRAFYEAFLGAAPVKVRPGYVKFLPDWAPLNLALSEGGPAGGPERVAHQGVQVHSRAEVLAHLARVRAAGLPVREEFGVDCCHANQDKFWVEDPDGLAWEVYVLNHDLEDGAAAPGCGTPAVAASSCCAPQA
jgi:catechol 2,3-dioxygenase-like lactoylglutathione lyase family enzyme